MTTPAVQLRRLPNGRDLPLPTRMTAGAAGFDLCAAEAVMIAAGEIAVVSCGFAIAIPAGFEGQVRARSGLSSRHGVTPVNAPGTIDADYRGEVMVPLINLGRVAFDVARGDRIAQLVVCPVPTVRFEEVAELPPSARDADGFGSTGR